MEPKFDRMAKMAVTSVSNLMGEPAIWHSSQYGPVSGRVLFKDPTEAVTIGNAEGYEYQPSTATAEYYKDDFVGLKLAVDSEKSEYLTVRGRCYLITSVDRKFDDNVFVAHLEPHDDGTDSDN